MLVSRYAVSHHEMKSERQNGMNKNGKMGVSLLLFDEIFSQMDWHGELESAEPRN